MYCSSAAGLLKRYRVARCPATTLRTGHPPARDAQPHLEPSIPGAGAEGVPFWCVCVKSRHWPPGHFVDFVGWPRARERELAWMERRARPHTRVRPRARATPELEGPRSSTTDASGVTEAGGRAVSLESRNIDLNDCASAATGVSGNSRRSLDTTGDALLRTWSRRWTTAARRLRTGRWCVGSLHAP